MIIDPELINVAVKATITGLIALLFFMIRSLIRRFKNMERETYKIESNHQQTQHQLGLLQQQMNVMLNTLLNREGNEHAKKSYDLFNKPIVNQNKTNKRKT